MKRLIPFVIIMILSFTILCKKSEPTWPPLPPLPGGWLSVTVKTPLKDNILGIEDLMLQTKDIDGKDIYFILKALYMESSDSEPGWGSPVWHNFTVQPNNGITMNLTGTYEAGKLVGYKFDLAALSSLKVKNEIAIYDQEGWRTVKIDIPLKHELLGVEDFKVVTKSPKGEINKTIKKLRLLDSRDSKAGLIWNTK